MRNHIEQGLQWWSGLSHEEKARWLQCAATPEEIDAGLQSDDPDVRAAVAIASIGDAFLAFNTSRAPTG